MANFRLDELKLELIAGQTSQYMVSGICNADSQNGEVSVPLDLTELAQHKDIILNIENIYDNKIKFNSISPHLDFANFGRRDYACLVAVDGPEDDAFKIELAGFAIKDTDYPPPYRGQNLASSDHRTFSGYFTIQKLFLKRQGTGVNFEVRLDINYTTNNYTPEDFRLIYDTSRPGMKALAIRVQKNLSGSTSGTISFPTTSNLFIDLQNFTDRGLPLFITENDLDDVDWSLIDTKKSILYIDTPIF